MPLDITLHVKRFAPKGEIFAVYLTADLTRLAPAKNLFVHVKGVPATAVRKIGEQLTQQWIGTVHERFPDGTIKRADSFGRQWRIPPNLIPAAARERLLRDRQITVTWAQAKAYIQNKKRNAMIKDADLEAAPDSI